MSNEGSLLCRKWICFLGIYETITNLIFRVGIFLAQFSSKRINEVEAKPVSIHFALLSLDLYIFPRFYGDFCCKLNCFFCGVGL